MDTELKPSVHFKRSKSNGQSKSISEDEDDADSSEEMCLIKKSKSISQMKRENSPYYGSNRSVNSPVQNGDDEELDSFDIKSTNKSSQPSLFSQLTCPAFCRVPIGKLVRFYSKYSAYFSLVKQLLLLGYCVVCLILFSSYDNAADKWTQTVISNSSLSYLTCHSHLSHSTAFYRVKLYGPFITLEDLSKRQINSGKYVNVNIYAESSLHEPIAKTWQLVIKLPDEVHK